MSTPSSDQYIITFIKGLVWGLLWSISGAFLLGNSFGNEFTAVELIIRIITSCGLVVSVPLTIACVYFLYLALKLRQIEIDQQKALDYLAKKSVKS